VTDGERHSGGGGAAPSHQAVCENAGKAKPTHRSKKNRKLTWSGCGSTPHWMKEEMKALKLKPDAFLIVGG
jgi:DNA-binding protein H-NS